MHFTPFAAGDDLLGLSLSLFLSLLELIGAGISKAIGWKIFKCQAIPGRCCQRMLRRCSEHDTVRLDPRESTGCRQSASVSDSFWLKLNQKFLLKIFEPNHWVPIIGFQCSKSEDLNQSFLIYLVDRAYYKGSIRRLIRKPTNLQVRKWFCQPSKRYSPSGPEDLKIKQWSWWSGAFRAPEWGSSKFGIGKLK